MLSTVSSSTIASSSSSNGSSFLCTGLNGQRRGQPNSAFYMSLPRQDNEAQSDPEIVRMLHLLPVNSVACTNVDEQVVERLRLLHDVKGYLRQSMVAMYREPFEHIRDERIAKLIVDERPINAVFAPITRDESENCMVCREMVPQFSVCSPRADGCNHCRLCELCLDEWVMRGVTAIPRCPGCRGPLRTPALRLAPNTAGSERL